jgi:hypothetical protein
LETQRLRSASDIEHIGRYLPRGVQRALWQCVRPNAALKYDGNRMPMPGAALDEVLTANLIPARVVSELGAPEGHFIGRYGDALMLMIKLQPAVDQLERGLLTSDITEGERVAPSVRAMAFDSALNNDVEDIRATIADSGAGHGIVRAERLRWLIRSDRFYVAPLRKRSFEESFRDRVSVGRAVNKDVVLRHPNVSKLHAWFELDEHGGVYIADADSSNGTWLNHQRLPARELTQLNAGQHLRFGSVEAIVCSAAALWHAVHR